MAVGGRKPKPRTLKLIEGNPGKKKIKPEVKPKPVMPEQPSWLSSEAGQVWADLAPKLSRLGLLTEVDGYTLAMCCTHYALAVKAAKQLRRQTMAKDERGLPRKHPAHQLLRDHSAAYRAYMAEFGLSPSARTRISIAEPDADDTMGGILD